MLTELLSNELSFKKDIPVSKMITSAKFDRERERQTCISIYCNLGIGYELSEARLKA